MPTKAELTEALTATRALLDQARAERDDVAATLAMLEGGAATTPAEVSAVSVPEVLQVREQARARLHALVATTTEAPAQEREGLAALLLALHRVANL